MIPESLLKLVINVGVPSALAVFLIYWTTSGISNDLDSLIRNQIKFEEQLRLHSVDSSYVLKETTQMKMILQQICVNTAQNRAESNMCF